MATLMKNHLMRIVCALTILLSCWPATAQWYSTIGTSIAFSTDSRVSRSPAAGASIGGGYRWDVLSVEGEIVAPSTGSATVIAASGTAYVHPWRFGPITPYGLAGIAWGHFNGSDTWGGHGRWTALYFAGIGAEYKVTPQWSVAADVRRYISEDERFYRTNGGLTNFRANVVGLRVRYAWDR